MTGLTRIEIFERGCAALQPLLKDPKDIYVCPLCIRGFSRQAVEHRVLTWEHVPPGSIGGKRIILTCSQCNSGGGAALDAAAHRRAQHNQFFEALALRTSDFEGHLKLHMSDEELNTRVIIRGTEVTIEILGGHNDPAAIHRVLESLEKHVEEGTWKDTEFKLSTIYGFKQRRSQLSDLRTAYLATFAMFGYRYIFRPELKQVRDQLHHPEQELLPKTFQTYLGWNTGRERSIWIIRDPVPLLYVQIDRSAIVLPSFEVPGEPWTKLTENLSNENQVTLRGQPEGWPIGPRFKLDLPEHGSIRSGTP